MRRIEAIKTFLQASTHADLAGLYDEGMEVQVNVAKDGGDPIEGNFKGITWKGWTDGVITWKSFRIPYGASSDSPHYEDKEIKFPIEKHADAIGLTGWDWKAQRSRYVAFDFDAILGHSDRHSKKLSPEELNRVREAAEQLDWVTVRKSTSGSGLHLYVFIESDQMIKNHTEHSALARAILGKMCGLCGFDFSAKVDICGGNMWVWARKMRGTEGLKLIKKGRALTDDEIPANWRDHLNVIKGSRHTYPEKVRELHRQDSLDDVCSKRQPVDLDDEHKKLLAFLEESKAVWSYEPATNMVVTHAYRLKEAHEALGLRGVYDTMSRGNDLAEQNCFMFPLHRGAWVVRRFTPGVDEHPYWEQDGNGWTKCYLNKDPEFKSTCRAFGGIEETNGGFFFREAEVANQAARVLGTELHLDPNMGGRECVLKQHKDGRLIAEIERKENDRSDQAVGYKADKTKWRRIFNVSVNNVSEPEAVNHDDIVRHLISENYKDAGWVVNTDNEWVEEPLTNIKMFMASYGYSEKDIKVSLGNCISKPWRLVNRPFEPEYPGARDWNREAVQLKYAPSGSNNPKFDTWLKVFNHTGSGLDEAVKHNAWCKQNGITTGGQYLLLWVAAIIQYPMEPLPYLFLYNQAEDTGKSIFHEVIELLFTRGCVNANYAITNKSNFNGELAGAILCYIEEVDLSKAEAAHNKMKDWVTSDTMTIHKKGGTPYAAANTTHWVQCANSHTYGPIFSGDTRVTMCFVPELEPHEMIPKTILVDRLIKEAPDFLQYATSVEIPEPNSRLRIPVIETEDKTIASDHSLDPLERFLRDHTTACNGSLIKFSDFYDRFSSALEPFELTHWSKQRVSRNLPPQICKGRSRKDNHVFLANIKFISNDEKPGPKWKIDPDGLLYQEADND